MTALQELYHEYRDVGNGHYEAVRKLAAKLEVDPGTVRRLLERADHDARRGTPMERKRGRRVVA